MPNVLTEVKRLKQAQDAMRSVATNKKHDAINSPSHYTSLPAKCECGRGIECIQVTEHFSFSRGNALKYLWRADHKNGLEDLRKARWYIDREIQRLEQQGNE